MKFNQSLISGTLLRRHSRFLADVKLMSGEEITAHTANTGSMMGCQEPGSTVWLSVSDNPKRKYAYTWEIIEAATEAGKTMIGINTMLSNKLVSEGIESGVITELQGYERIRTEVKYGAENSRIDLLLVPHENSGDSDSANQPCYVEVKNVTLVQNDTAFFPDAVSKRGSKHLRELIDVAKRGERAVIFFCVQRVDAVEVRPADHIDPEYGNWLRRAVDAGVEAMAYQAMVAPDRITLAKRLPVVAD